MKKIIFFLAPIFVTGFCISCTYKKEALLYPPSTTPTCDTNNIKYSVQIKSIIDANCNSCHGGNANLGGGIPLDNYTDLTDAIKFGLVIGNMQYKQGFRPMPKSGVRVSDCDIAKVIAWVNKGMPNN